MARQGREGRIAGEYNPRSKWPCVRQLIKSISALRDTESLRFEKKPWPIRNHDGALVKLLMTTGGAQTDLALATCASLQNF